MARAPYRLSLYPEACDGCGRCSSVCKAKAIRLGPSFIYVDWEKCTGCYECVEACDRAAIQMRVPATAAATAGPAAPSSDGLRVPVISPPAAEKAASPAWSLRDAGALMLVVLALYLLQELVMGLPAVSSMGVNGLVTFRAVLLVVYYAGQIAVLSALARRHGVEFLRAMRLWLEHGPAMRWLSSVAWVLLSLVAVRVLATVYGLIAEGVGWHGAGREQLTRFFGPGQEGLFLAVAMVVLVGPFVEELVFRGVVLTALRRAIPEGASVVVAAVLFSAFHFSLWMFVPTLMLGLALGTLAVKRETLWPAIALHSLYNAVAVGAAFWVVAQR